MIIVDNDLANAIIRFSENAVEAMIYKGIFMEILNKKVNGKVIRPDDTLTLSFSAEILYNDILMLQHNLTRGNDVQAGYEVEIGEGGKYETSDLPSM